MNKESSLESERFYQLLFELSHESRYMILQFLMEKPLRVTEIAKRLDLTSQEISRHVSRLSKIKVIYKDINGLYSLSPLGMLCLRNLESLSFTSKNVDYFYAHDAERLPESILKRLSEMNDSIFLDNAMDFLQNMVNVIEDAQEYLLLASDHFPIHALSEITSRLEEGVILRLIEPLKGFQGPNFSLDSKNESKLERLLGNPVVERRVADTRHLIILSSEKAAMLALPTPQNEINYRGFYVTESTGLTLVHDLFTSLWTEKRSDTVQVKKPRIELNVVSGDRKSVVIHGHDDPIQDRIALQDAVDSYEEVVLRGGFNLGDRGITISKGVKIRGDGRKDGKPLTYVYMSGWDFPFNELSSLFLIDADDCEVSVENIYFNDFKFICIHAVRGNKITLKNNWIALDYAVGRGRTNPVYGDTVMGILVNGPGHEYNPGFPDGVIIEDNYLDFAGSYLGGYYDHIYLLDESERKSVMRDHKYFNGYGIYVRWARGKVAIKNNVVKNSSSKGIVASENYETSEVAIRENLVECNIPGSHIIDARWAGIGIEVEPGFHYQAGGFRLSLDDNKINITQPRFCGIMIKGIMKAPTGSKRLSDGLVKGNDLILDDGSIGILLESCEKYRIFGNRISGATYYGIGLFPGAKDDSPECGAIDNHIESNNFDDLVIKPSDDYSRNLFTGKSYGESSENLPSSHISLNQNTRNNTVKQQNSIIVDAGIGNRVFEKDD